MDPLMMYIVMFVLGALGVFGLYKALLTAKGSLGVGLVLVIVAFLGVASIVADNANTGGIDKDPNTLLSLAGPYQTILDVSTPSAGSLNADNKAQQLITFTDSDLNSANDTTVTFTMTTTRIDGLTDDTTNVPSLIYRWNAYDYSNKDTPSETTKYYTVNYSATNLYNFSVNGATYKTRQSSDAIAKSSAATAAVSVVIEHTTNLDKGIVNNYVDILKLGEICSYILEGKQEVLQSCVTMRYIQTP